MRIRIAITLLVLMFSLNCFAEFVSLQNKIERIPPEAFQKMNLFSPKSNSVSTTLLPQYVSKFDLVEADPLVLKQIAHSTAPLEISLPIDGSWQTILLVKNDGLDNCIYTTQSNNGQFLADYIPGSYYLGHIQGQPEAVVAISFFEGDIIGMVLQPNGNFVIGRSNMHHPIENEFVIYNDQDMLVKDIQSCAVDNNSKPIRQEPLQLNGIAETYTTKCVRFYWEGDYEMYTDFSSNITSTNNYLSGLYNLVSTLYYSDSILTGLSQVNVWTTSDPYAALTSTSDMLNAFSSNMSTAVYTGDLAHLLSTKSAGGGIAWLDVLCSSNYYKTGVSASLSTTLTPLPTFSWNTEVVTHEIGHNMASPHTHACNWNGNNTKIDDCGGNAGYSEGTCGTNPPNPAGGGTIMSYCHLQAVGINLSLGFGPQPGSLIRNTVNASSCLGQCLTCPGAITITGNYSTALTESSTYIASSGQTTISPTTSVKLDATPAQGYVLMAPSNSTSFFVAAPTSNAAVFVAQAFNGCSSGAPARPAESNEELNSISSLESDEFMVYPNPTQEKIYVSNKYIEPQLISYTLQSLDGRVVLNSSNEWFNGLFELNLQSIPQGIYFLQITYAGKSSILKIQKTQ
jgi:hypothetical protein